MSTNQELEKQVAEKLRIIQNYSIEALPRKSDLGKELNFELAVEPAKKIIGLYNKISVSVLEDLPIAFLQKLSAQLDVDLKNFENIMAFSPSQQNDPKTVRDAYINKLITSYDSTFNVLVSIISFSASKTTDLKGLENRARVTIEKIEEEANKLTEQLKTAKSEAEDILTEVRKTAAEQGVSQQAIYFSEASANHDKSAKKWFIATISIAISLGFYALGSLFIHKIPQLTPTDIYQNIQLSLSKALIFAVLSYMLYLCARNFLSNKHNAIVNKHRQNSLMTYNALVEASQELKNKEVILTHASACIFSPQLTGFSKDSGNNAPNAKSVIELIGAPLSADGQ